MSFVVAACGSDSGGGGGGKASGDTLTIYSSLPLQGDSRPQSEDVVHGEQLALDKFGGAYFASVNPGNPLDPGRLQLSITGANVPGSAVTTTTVGNQTYKHLDPEKVESLYVVCRYQAVS